MFFLKEACVDNGANVLQMFVRYPRYAKFQSSSRVTRAVVHSMLCLTDVIDGSEAKRHLMALVLGYVDHHFAPRWSWSSSQFVACSRTAHSWLFIEFDEALLRERIEDEGN